MKAFIFLFLSVLSNSIYVSAQNVGIGTLTPHPNTILHVEIPEAPGNKGFLVNGIFNLVGSIPDLGAGSRLMFFPGRGIFRAGVVSGTQWDYTNSGFLSTAFGNNTIAKGIASTAMGSFAFAGGTYSVAMGQSASARSAAEISIGMYNTDYIPLSTNDWFGADRLFVIGNGQNIDNLSDAMVVLKNGNVGIGYSAPVDKLQVNGNGFFNGVLAVTGNTTILGFTKLGGVANSVPKIKMKKLDSTSSPTQGTWVNIPHGLNASKIIAVDILMDVPGFVHLPPAYTFHTQYEYHYQVQEDNIVVLNKTGNSANILSRAFRVLITYEE